MSWRSLFGLTRRPTLERFANELLEQARKAGAPYWEFDPKEQALRDTRNAGHRLNLTNIFLEYTRAKTERRPALIQKSLAVLTTSRTIPKLWGVAAGGIYPALRSRYLTSIAEIELRGTAKPFPPAMIRPWVDDVIVALLYDFGPHMGMASKDIVESWGAGEQEVWSRAGANLRALPRPTWQPLNGGIFRIASSVAYEESFLLVDEVLESLKLTGPPVFAIPNKGVCLAADSTNESALRALLAEIKRSLEQAPWPLSAALFERTLEGWRTFEPPAELAASVRRLRLLDLARTYEIQKAALDKLNRRTGADIFVASFVLRAPKDRPDEVASFATWSAGIDTLLPKSEHIILGRGLPPTPEVLPRPWARVREVCGQYFEATPEDPPRYRVRAFPNEAEWEQLKANV